MWIQIGPMTKWRDENSSSSNRFILGSSRWDCNSAFIGVSGCSPGTAEGVWHMDTSGVDQRGISGCIDWCQTSPNNQVCIASIHKYYRTVFRIEIISVCFNPHCWKGFIGFDCLLLGTVAFSVACESSEMPTVSTASMADPGGCCSEVSSDMYWICRCWLSDKIWIINIQLHGI